MGSPKIEFQGQSEGHVNSAFMWYSGGKKNPDLLLFY